MDMQLGQKLHQSSNLENFLPGIFAIHQNITNRHMFKESQYLSNDIEGPNICPPYTNHLRDDAVLEEQQHYPYVSHRFPLKLVERLKGFKTSQRRKRFRSGDPSALLPVIIDKTSLLERVITAILSNREPLNDIETKSFNTVSKLDAAFNSFTYKNGKKYMDFIYEWDVLKSNARQDPGNLFTLTLECGGAANY
ncbi:hypothetical protein BC833DRAFT_625405 [Globomyces pollinis-pini]|nr:hypothetical protein BC833DRAFT_625405 [Globomyces pollinis-pini]